MFIYPSPMTDSSGINEGREDWSKDKQLMLETSDETSDEDNNGV